MKIILVGGGKVGTALARQLREEDHNAVSYTHLDVYKRQVFYWRNAGKMQRTLREKSTKVILVSVLSAKKQKRHVQIAANQV